MPRLLPHTASVLCQLVNTHRKMSKNLTTSNRSKKRHKYSFGADYVTQLALYESI